MRKQGPGLWTDPAEIMADLVDLEVLCPGDERTP